MAIEKQIKSRIICKHDTEVNWNKATTFIPNQGELIVYDIDDDYSYERFKIGDGVQNVINLPFADDHVISMMNEFQKTITGTAGQFVVIGNDGNVTTKPIAIAEEGSF